VKPLSHFRRHTASRRRERKRGTGLLPAGQTGIHPAPRSRQNSRRRRRVRREGTTGHGRVETGVCQQWRGTTGPRQRRTTVRTAASGRRPPGQGGLLEVKRLPALSAGLSRGQRSMSPAPRALRKCRGEDQAKHLVQGQSRVFFRQPGRPLFRSAVVPVTGACLLGDPGGSHCSAFWRP
jgi:hypothetical protein